MAESATISETTDPPTESPFSGKRVVFLGKLGGMNRREAIALTKLHGGVAVDRKDSQVDLIVIGADELPLADDDLLTTAMRRRYESGEITIIHETELWEQLGLLPEEGAIRKLYTPAMLADLLKIPISVIRRWHRRGLIVPTREVHRLAYFDFQEVATARHLAKLLQAGATPDAIENKLAQLARWMPNADRPLAQLSVIVEGRDLLLRQGEGLVDATGQRRFDFDASPKSSDAMTADHHERVAPAANLEQGVSGLADHGDLPSVVPFEQLTTDADARPDREQFLDQAAEMEENGLLEEAVDMYRTVLTLSGPDASINFELAELLYRLGDVSAARERYYATLEIDSDFVEARANLGCVLAETGQLELAVAAFQGALVKHDAYPDVHYHLARVLDDLGNVDDAIEHWRSFLSLAPDSPWATEARDRLGLESIDDEVQSEL